ncbi:MAG: tRNA (N6-isopentenyl adenosine(37)-C2)-methylthiotransferase MiaB [Spirochaetales bacterium]|nr:tRNA (N6-isopentenyl adenosine(37)-C2)-methylthiotransferase MiaB [Spirochaetales bacterium]
MPSYLLETYGCQMNKAESAALELLLAERGWKPVADPELADLVLINTCSVRITAENRAWGRIALYAALKKRRPFALVVTGCMAERLKHDMRATQPAIDYVVGTFQKQAFGLVLDAVAAGKRLEEIEESPVYEFASSYHEPGAFRSFLPIMHGCENFCTYCIVPYVRGKEVSRDPATILSELGELEERGIREVTLLGQNVSSYRWKEEGGELDFPALLERIAGFLEGRGKGGIRWIRFLTSHPKDFDRRTMDVIASSPVFCRHVHLVAQHGSNRVLKAMNRKYTRESYLSLVDELKARVPGVTVSSDILMGFPGETENDVEDTLDLMRRAGYVYSYTYHYNPRAGTPAATMPDQVADAVKKQRLARVIGLQRELSRDSMKALVGGEVEVLVEDVSKKRADELLGRTQQDMMVVFPGPSSRVGSFARVRLTGLRGNTFRAVEVP